MSSSPSIEAPAAAFVCDCQESWRSACEKLPFFKEHEGKRYCVLHYPDKEKGAAFNEVLRRKFEAEDFDFRGVWFPAAIHSGDFTFASHADFRHATFSELANFSDARFSKGAIFERARFNEDAHFIKAEFADGGHFVNAEFGGMAIFREAKFKGATNFNDATFAKRADFTATFDRWVSFSSATFGEKAYFRVATFGGEVYFNETRFGGVTDFNRAGFGEAHFSGAEFGEGVTFIGARFGLANFSRATFAKGVDFSYAAFEGLASFGSTIFKDQVRFEGRGEEKVFGDNSTLSLTFARVEKPDRFTFHTLTLRPHWFVNVDARKFEFINVDWNWPDIDIRREIKSTGESDIRSAHRLLAIACRNLAVNAEDNHRYEEASRFRYMAMEARRLEHRRRFAVLKLDWWYWLASGYGESMGRALAVLLGMLVLFATLYVGLGFPNWGPRAGAGQAAAGASSVATGKWSQWPSALLYSLGVMTLQKPEPRPATDAAQALVMLETILGPVQAALLALAIRRKFMR